MTQSDIPNEPEQPPREPPPVFICPSCSAPMEFRGAGNPLAGSQYRDDIFVCPNCNTRILRPRKA
jgi:DNA-directed RNA polymerase subunit RPC12/RpoP